MGLPVNKIERTKRYRLFALHYVRSGNAKAAARAAGYSARGDGTGHRLLAHPEVQKLVAAAKQLAADEGSAAGAAGAAGQVPFSGLPYPRRTPADERRHEFARQWLLHGLHNARAIEASGYLDTAGYPNTSTQLLRRADVRHWIAELLHEAERSGDPDNPILRALARVRASALRATGGEFALKRLGRLDRIRRGLPARPPRRRPPWTAERRRRQLGE